MPTQSAPRAEHISIEAEPEILAPKRPPHRAVLSTFQLRSKLRGCHTEISILDEHYVQVKAERLNAPAKKYVLDLRFVNAKPELVRHVARGWLAAAIVLLLTGVGSFWWAASSAAGTAADPGLFVGIGATIAAAITSFYFLRHTTESLDFISVHGGARLVSILGGIGSAKTGKRFFIEMIKNIDAAKLARPQSKQEWLRDEMREHHRLRELKVLTEEEYVASQARILKAHS
jgi:hypothetical protein